MAKSIQIKRGLEANRSGITPAVGELIWTTDNKDLWIGDGSTAGGIKITANVEGSYVPNSEKGAANGVATLDTNGQIPTSQLSPLALTDVFTAASETAQLGLTAQEGDVCVRTDENKSYIHNGGTAGDMTDWQELLTPTDAVQSVNGKTGVVSLAVGDMTDVDTTTTTPSNTDVLQFNGSDWVPVGVDTVGRTNFYALDDTPANYTGSGGYSVRVNSGATALEFVESTLENLSDVVISSIADGDYIKWDNTNSQWVNAAPQTIDIDDLSDVDTTTTAPTNGQVLEWDGTNWVPATNTSPSTTDDLAEGSTNLYYTDTRVGTYISGTAILTDISDVDTGATNNQILAWDNTNSKWSPVDPGSVTATTLIALSDTPSSYASGDAGKFLRVNAAEDAVEFATADTDDISEGSTNLYYTDARADARIAAASIDDLSDVDTSTTSPSSDDVLSWDGSNWVPTSIDGGTF